MGPWLRNKGDVLNLWSVAQHYGDSATLAVSSGLGLERLPDQPPLRRVKWRPNLASIGKAASAGAAKDLARLCRDSVAVSMPRDFLSARGFVAGRDIDGLLDCSGYAYGDGWSLHRTQARASYYARLKRQGAAVVMLPQAFGPFEKPEVRQACRDLFAQCDLIFARDPESLAHLAEIGVKGDRVGLAPDITHLLRGEAPRDAEAWSRRVCIVPNARMLDRTSPETRDAYAAFLGRSMGAAEDLGLEPVLLIHEENDRPLAQQLRDASPSKPQIIDEDALRSKGILAESYALIGSRYHAIVSALSQGVPTMGTSWSHKYEMLFADYGCSDQLAAPEAGAEVLDAQVRAFLDPQARNELAGRLGAAAKARKAAVEAMWAQIDELLRRSPRPATAEARALEAV